MMAIQDEEEIGYAFLLTKSHDVSERKTSKIISANGGYFSY